MSNYPVTGYERVRRIAVAAIILVSVLLLAGCDRGKVEKLEAENSKLKSELETVQLQVQELAAKQKQETTRREQEEVRRKQEADERELAATKQQKEQEAKKLQAIEKCFDKIDLQMKALLDEPRPFGFKTPEERKAIESRLKTLANTKKEGMGELVIELKGLGLSSESRRALENAIDTFVGEYSSVVFYDRLSFDYASVNSTTEASEQQKESGKALREAYSAKRKVAQIKHDALAGDKSKEI